MKHQDLNKYHQMPVRELQVEIDKLAASLNEQRLTQSLGKQKNVHLVTHLRHDLARLKTILKQHSFTKKGVWKSIKVKSWKLTVKKLLVF